MGRSPLAILLGIALVPVAAAPAAAQRIECLAPFDAACRATVPPGDHELAVAVRLIDAEGKPVSKAYVLARPDAGTLEVTHASTSAGGVADFEWTVPLRAGTGATLEVVVVDPREMSTGRVLAVRGRDPIRLERIHDGQHGYADWKLDRPVGVALVGVDEPGCGRHHARFRADLSGSVSPVKAPAEWDAGRCVALTTWKLGKDVGHQEVDVEVYDAPGAWKGSDPPTPYRLGHARVRAIARAEPTIDVGMAFTTLKKGEGADSEAIIGVDLAPVAGGRGSPFTERLRFFFGTPADPDVVLDRVYAGLVVLPTLAFPTRESLPIKLIAGGHVRTTRGLEDDGSGVENESAGWFLSGAFDLSGLASTVLKVLGIT